MKMSDDIKELKIEDIRQTYTKKDTTMIVTVDMSVEDLTQIKELIKGGYYLNVSEFVRMAIISVLQTISITNLVDLNKKLYPSTITMPIRLLETLDNLCDELEISRSGMVRVIINKFLNQNNNPFNVLERLDLFHMNQYKRQCNCNHEQLRQKRTIDFQMACRRDMGSEMSYQMGLWIEKNWNKQSFFKTKNLTEDFFTETGYTQVLSFKQYVYMMSYYVRLLHKEKKIKKYRNRVWQVIA